jgi:hypothetical protein
MEALRSTLLAAKSIAYSDSGKYFYGIGPSGSKALEKEGADKQRER